jgi:hypothetical protein
LFLCCQAQQLASQQEQMTRQQQLEAIEKAFAEQANNFDRFIVEEEKKVCFSSLRKKQKNANDCNRDLILLRQLLLWSLSSSLEFLTERKC